ncbi:phosphonate C-P lyase system protein PhnG [Roseovarius sp. MMSF_3281]|uniref:phosphonate C-P lyase system protein PhnG n=1 Tax=Roseovarius sp. MMSF_3281 TaxID=3046694 RepID=UPI00273D5777|nr:phosphonate C-P lyase system protein PhnG [Roseovarius sp. MMSF_3281]
MTEIETRKHWMGLLAKAKPQDVAALFEDVTLNPEFTYLRAPEVGGVMVQGRAGATGAPFNLGEMTVTRCSVQLAEGEVGHAYVQGRDKAHATQAALIDALMQTPEAERLRLAVLAPLEQSQVQARTARASKAAATKVDFFTMVRGED